jgi:hypothetical protein
MDINTQDTSERLTGSALVRLLAFSLKKIVQSKPFLKEK